LKTENWKLFLSFQAGNNYQIFFIKINKINKFCFFFFFSRLRAQQRGGRERGEGRGGREKGGEGDASARMLGCVRADMGASAQTHSRLRGCSRVRADAVFTASADGKNPSAGKTAFAG
jgi:hypothetical protein